MPADEVAQAPAAEAPAAEPAASEPAAAPAGAKPKAGTPELARWHGQRAQAAIAKADAERAAAADGEQPTGTPPKDPVTGKFLKRDKAKTEAAPKEPKPAAPAKAEPKPDKPEGAVPDSIAAVRRLASEGKWEEAFQRAFGRVPGDDLGGKGWAAWRAESKRLRADVEAKSADIQKRESQLRQIHSELAAEFKPMHDARKALERGDLDEAFKLWAGVDFNTFSRNHLRQSTGPNVGKDPAFMALQRELQEMRRENQEYRQREQEQQKTSAQERAQREYVERMVTELEASDDPRIARAAKRQAFQKKVLEKQQEHYDAATDWTIPFSEAAQLAIEDMASEYGEWNEVFGSQRAPAPEPRGETRTPPARAATPARQTPSRVTTLSQKEAAEAATEPKLRGKALLEKWTAKAVAAQYKANGIG